MRMGMEIQRLRLTIGSISSGKDWADCVVGVASLLCKWGDFSTRDISETRERLRDLVGGHMEAAGMVRLLEFLVAGRAARDGSERLGREETGEEAGEVSLA